jgi:hypothetical protein
MALHQLRLEKRIDIFPESPDQLRARLFSKLTLGEFAALSFNVLMLGIFIFLGTNSYNGFADYQVYLNAGIGQYITSVDFDRGYYYAYWILPLFSALNWVPYWLGIFIWGVINISGFWIGSRIFGNKSSIVLMTYQTLFALFMGQIIGVIIWGVALLWFGLKTEKWFLAAIGLIIASTKYHVGGIIALALIILIDLPLKRKLQVMLYSGFLFILSLIIYPNWPMEILGRIRSLPLGGITDISLWRWLGPAVLLFWIPPLIIKFSKMDRLIMITSTLCFAIPYFQAYDLILLWIFPVGWIALLGNLAYSSFFVPIVWQKLLVIIPIAIYLRIFIRWTNRKGNRESNR